MIRQQITSLRCLFLLALGAALVLPVSVSAQTAQQAGATPAASGAQEESGGGAEGSNPLASTSKLDFVSTFTKSGGSFVTDISAEGAFMLHPRVKFVYELHYFVTDVTGKTENDWETLHLKPIWFPKDFKLSKVWGMRLAVGGELIIDFNNLNKGIGTGSDQVGPLVGLAFMNRETGLALIPLVQHFESYESGAVSQTAFRVIGLKPLPANTWIKLDGKVPYDWVNHAVPFNFELEFGKMFTPKVGVFAQVLGGIGSDRPFDWGSALAMRLNF